MTELDLQAAAKRPRTASKETRRRQLIEATIASIAAHGISGTTMATVTGEAELSTGIVGFHFKSKENLLRETLLHLVEEHRDFWRARASDPELSPADRLAAVVEANFHPSICTRERIAVWFAFFGEAKYRETYHKRVSRFDIERTDFLEETCREIIVEGHYGGLDPADVAWSVESFADGLWLSLMLYPERLTPGRARARIIEYLSRVFPDHFHAGTNDTHQR